MLTRKIYYLLPPGLRLVFRRLYYLPIDAFEKLTGKRDALTPPRGLIYVGSGDFRQTGETLVAQLKQTTKLQPESAVLDVGCGIGRLAVPLTKVLNTSGRYEGFDIVKNGIDWCKKHISSQYPNFNFIHVDLKNDLYNLTTSEEAKNFTFPYPNDTFDLVVLTSVFTHMMPDDVKNYLKEISRVLKPNGQCFVTFFLLNDEIKSVIDSRSEFHFPYIYEHYRLLDKNVKEANIAFEEKYLIDELIKPNHLAIENIYHGWWSGKDRSKALGFQDVVVIKKTA